DEPTGELDPQSSIKIFELISEMNRAFGTTVIVIEQKIMLLANYVKRLAVLSHGKICRDGTVRDVLRHSDELRQIGVNCPRVVTLSDNLSRRGFFDPPQIAINVDEAALMIGEKL
ncbi:MAG: ABC transporter ATP-binding protein, partial [Eubacteriales bacterium]